MCRHICRVNVWHSHVQHDIPQCQMLALTHDSSHVWFPLVCSIDLRFTMRASHIYVWFYAVLCVICPQMAFCVFCMYLPYITLHDLVDYHFSMMSLAFGGRGYIVRRQETDVGVGFDSTLGFPGEGPMKKRDRKRKLTFKRINLEATASEVMQQVQIQSGQMDSHAHTTHPHTDYRPMTSATRTFSKIVCKRNEGV